MTTEARDARSVAEEGFHEIQLSGKQLVFLFMATTVVSIFIFLCGVLVGRGVRAQVPDLPPAASNVAPAGGALPAGGPAPAASAPPAAPAGGAPAVARGAEAPKASAANDEVPDYYKQLVGDEKNADTLKVPAEAPPAPSEPTTPPATKGEPASATAKAEPPRAPAEAAPPAREVDGFTVQVAALRERSEAEAIVKRLIGNGYDAYVLEPGAGSASKMFRVRVGNFKERKDADAVVKRLAKEEQFKPWITR